MRDVLLASCPVLLWVFTVFHLLFFINLLRGFIKRKNPLYLACALLSFALLFDALVISLGVFLRPSDGLKAVSQLRFVSHGMFVPLFFPICAYALNFGKKGRGIVWVITGVIMLFGAISGFVTDLEVKEIAGVCRYTSSAATPTWANSLTMALSYGTVAPEVIAGIYVWIKHKTPVLFLSGFLMFAFSALGPASGNLDLIFFISMIGEVLMMVFLYFYARFVETKLLPKKAQKA